MIGITGCTGFIGGRLGTALSNAGLPWVGLARRAVPFAVRPLAGFGDLAALTAACAGLETLFHCAGYAHALSSLNADDSEKHREFNFVATRNMVEAAALAGVKRFVFLSSVKAMAEPGSSCADEDFPGLPETAYGQAKRAAESAVLDVGKRCGMHVVNLRLAMVYGSGGRGNLERMGRLQQVLEDQGMPPELAFDVLTLTLSLVRGFAVRTLLVNPRDRFAPELEVWRG